MSIGATTDPRTTSAPAGLDLLPPARRDGAAGSAAAGGTWYIANYVTPPSHQDHSTWRGERFQRRRVSSALVIEQDRDRAGAPDDVWVRPRRVARCSWRLGDSVGVHVGASGAHFSGAERCGSVWSCPVCAAVIRAERAAEIESGVMRHMAGGGGALFVTGTIRHAVGDTLAVGLEAVLEGWRRVIRGTPWKKWAARLGLVGVIRSVEVTRGHRNGWHPHLHGILLTEAPVSSGLRQAFDAWVTERWRVMVEKLGARLPSAARGFTVQNVDGDGRVLARYLVKLQEEKKRVGIGAEIARGDLKNGRRGSRLPFELLDTAGHNDKDRDLWLEYVDATAGRLCFTWSKGLRKALALEEDRTDDQIMADGSIGELVGVIDAQTYDILRTCGQLADLLEQIETAAAGGEAGYLLQLVTPKRGEGVEVDSAQRLPEVLRSNNGLPMDLRLSRVRAAQRERLDLPEVGGRDPHFGPFVLGAHVLNDAPRLFALRAERQAQQLAEFEAK